ncbi:MAG: DUF896 domain-containing protein [Eubacteriaceae bacterium]|jgi:uncharacterized protein YnzC (UPF0291/DUF896 family)
MIGKEKIDRINELAKKKKEEGLTEEETAERKALHDEYVKAVKDNVRAQLDNIQFVDTLVPEEEWTDEEKAHAAELTGKLKKEFEAQNERDEEVRTTIEGNPGKPEGESGLKMVERMNESHRPLTDWALDGADLPSESEECILDVGFGGGAALQNLEQRFPKAQLYGIDYSEVSVKAATDLNRDAVIEGRMILQQGSVSELPFGDDKFALIISVESYFFWPDFAEDVKGIARVLKPGGTLMIIAEMYENGALSDYEQRMAEKFELQLQTPEQFQKVYTAAGLTDIDIRIDGEKGWICAQGRKK